jgi:hypothetical protein
MGVRVRLPLATQKINIMTKEEKDEILNSFKWIKVKKFNDDLMSYDSYEDYIHAFEVHHIEETTFLINKIRELVEQMPL